MSAARANGYDQASLGVDADSLTGAVGLYKQAFTVEHTWTAYRKAANLAAVTAGLAEGGADVSLCGAADAREAARAGIRLASIHIYPMKAGRAVDLGQSRVEPWGLAGDRRWLLVDEDGRCITQREAPSLARVTVAYGRAPG